MGNVSSSPDDGTLARIDALRIVSRWEESGDFPDRMFGSVPPYRRPFVMDLVYTTVRRIRALAYALDNFVPRRPDNQRVWCALVLGAAQIIDMHGIPEHAAVASTVEAAKAFAGVRHAGFVNAVLRNLIRNLPAVRQALQSAPLAIRASHTDAQVERWIARWGAEKAAAICEWDDTPAHATALTLPGGPEVAAIVAAFLDAGVKATVHPGAPGRAVVIPHGSHIDSLPGFAEGLWTVQDPATLQAVRLLGAQPGMRVWDACAAPGGKSVQIAAAMGGKGLLVATDCWRDRLDPLRENFSRFRIDQAFARVFVADAKRASGRDLGGLGPFDRILVDAPCSNTGVQRRRADARWRFSPERLSSLASTQLAILENAALRHLAPGGRIVYSTCSIEREENEGVAEEFLRRHPEFKMADSAFLVPPDKACDGAFAAAFELRDI